MTIHVTREHIDADCRSKTTPSAVAVAIHEATGKHALIEANGIYLGGTSYRMPHTVRSYFYLRSIKRAQPFSFELPIEE